jgi:hypothetical protein
VSKRSAAGALPVAHLVADPENPRHITDENLAGLEASVEDFGDLSGIVFNERTGQLVCGHQRVLALKRAGAVEMQEVDERRWRLVHPKTGEEFPVRRVDWPAEKQRLANLTANNPHVAGEFTAAALAQLRALEDDAAFAALRLDELQTSLRDDFPDDGAGGGDGGGNTDPDDVPEPPAEPITRPGDLYVLGDHRLLCGDSTKAADVARLMGGERPALGLHDPPYGIGIQHNAGNIGDSHAGGIVEGKYKTRSKTHPMIAGDDRPFDPQHLLDGAALVVIWGANHFAHKLAPSAAWLVWDKRDGLASNDFSDCELAWCSKGGRVAMFRMMWSGVARPKAEDGAARVHPTQKPIALYRWIIEEKTEPGALVYDAYGGSGPTVLACEKLGRRARVMELAPAYCDVILARWEAFTGRKAECHHAASDPVHGDDNLAF